MKSMQDLPANPLEKPGYKLEWSDEFDGLQHAPGL